MRNILGERPTRDLQGVAAYARSFVAVDDCRDRDVLDIGCGFGWFELLALDRGARSIVGIEPRDENLRTAKQHIDDPLVRFQVGDALDLPFVDESFDTVVCWEVLEHLPRQSERRAFAEISRVLRPGGILYLSTPAAALVAKVTDPAWWLIGHRHYRAGDVRRFAEEAGLRVERIERKAGLWQIVWTLDLYVAKWIFRRPPFFAERLGHRLEHEWMRDSGFEHLFVRCRKPS
jgi:SAM-dependent methyltransferase